MDIGQRLAFVPGWEDYDTDRIRITMDPGMASGTGTHDTTSLCPELLVCLGQGAEPGLDSRPRDTASAFRNISTSDSEAISLLTQLHQQLVEQFDTDAFDWSNDDVTSLDLTYTLINGTRISRSYMVPLHETDETRPGTITYLAHEIVNNPDLMLSSYLFPHLEEKGYELLGADLYANYDVAPFILSVSEARKVFEAVLLDIQEGNLPHRMFPSD